MLQVDIDGLDQDIRVDWFFWRLHCEVLSRWKVEVE